MELKQLDDLGELRTPRLGYWDNAVAESFFSTLKLELVHNVIFTTKASAEFAAAEWIEVYSGRRRHSSIGHLAPAEFERRYYANLNAAHAA